MYSYFTPACLYNAITLNGQLKINLTHLRCYMLDEFSYKSISNNIFDYVFKL